VAVRFDAQGEWYTRSTGLTTVTTWAVTCWAKLAVDRAATTILWQIDNNSGGNLFRLNAWDGRDLTYETAGGSWFGLMGHALTAAEWTFIGVSGTSNPGQVRYAVRTAGGSTWVTGDLAQNNVTFNANTLRLAGGTASSEWFNGTLAAVKAWNAMLTVDELQQEALTYMPQRTADVRGWYPLLTSPATDYSGLGNTLAGGSGVTQEDGPPIAWRSRRPTIVIPITTSALGSLAATLPPLGASVDGTVTVAGQAASTLPTLTTGLVGDATVTGQTTPVLPPLGADLTGDSTAPGLLAADLPPLAASFDGELTGGFLTPALPPLGAAFDGSLHVHGTTPAALPSLTAALAGHADIPHNDITFTAGPPRRGWNAGTPSTGWTANQTTTTWTARQPATAWAAGKPARAWQARQPTTRG
jgi:hypothetical protein